MKKVEKKPLVNVAKDVKETVKVVEKLAVLKDVVVKVETPKKEYIGGKEVISKKTVVINGNKKTEKTLIDGSTCL